MRRRELLAALLAASLPLGLEAAEALAGLIGAAGPTAGRVLGAPGSWQPQILWTPCVREGAGWQAQATQSFGLRPRQCLQAAARAAFEQVADPLVFGLTWPLFGLAAALSVMAAARYLSAWPRRRARHARHW